MSDFIKDSWFPIASEQINNAEFIKLTPSEKVYFWTVLSELNLVGESFYKSDAWFAAFLGLSLEKIRKARAKLAKLGFIEMIPGKRIRGRNLSTTYISVKWLEMVEGKQFFKIDRTTFYKLIDYVRYTSISHADLCAFVYVNYFIDRQNGKGVSVLKSEFKEISNLPRAISNIEYIHSAITFNDGSSLFSYIEHYRTLEFRSVFSFVFNAKECELRQKEVEREVRMIQIETGVLTKDSLGYFYCDLYEIHYRKQYSIANDPKGYFRDLEKLYNLKDRVDVVAALKEYFKEKRPKGHSLSGLVKDLESNVS